MNFMNLFVTKALAERQGNIDSDAVNKAALIAGFVPSFAGVLMGKVMIDRAVEEEDQRAVERQAAQIAAEKAAKAAADEKAAEAAQDKAVKDAGDKSSAAQHVAEEATKTAETAKTATAQFETIIVELKADNARMKDDLKTLREELKIRGSLPSGEKAPNAKKA